MNFWAALFSMIFITSSLSSATMAQSTAPPKAGSAAPPKAGSTFASIPVITPEMSRWLLASSHSYDLSKVGDNFAKQGDWQNAQEAYQKALDLYPTNRQALYGMAACSQTAGDTNAQLSFYRKVVYSINPADRGFSETDPEKLMQFVLLLSQAGYADEALTVYTHAASLLNYMDGKQNIPMMLPAFGSAPGQVPYSAKRVKALAHVGIAVKTQDGQEKQTHLDEAIRLQPDLATAYFYKGRQALTFQTGHSREARDAFRAAARYGDPSMRAEVAKATEGFSIERDAKYEQDMEDLHKKQMMQKK